jgi:hypothetical protein
MRWQLSECAAASVVRVRSSRPVGHSTCVAYARGRNRWSPLRPWCGSVLRDLSAIRPAWRIHEAKTCRLVLPRVVSDYLVVEDPRYVVNRRNVPGGRRCVRSAGPFFATCRPFDQRDVFTKPKPVVLACRGSFPTIWWSRTLDTLATVGMCPVVAAASVERVLALRGFTGRRRQAAGTTNGCRRWPFDLRSVFTKPKPVVWSCRESSFALFGRCRPSTTLR